MNQNNNQQHYNQMPKPNNQTNNAASGGASGLSDLQKAQVGPKSSLTEMCKKTGLTVVFKGVVDGE